MNRMPSWIDDLHIAHRGYFNDSCPENSLAAFKRAIDHGYAIELDVQMLKDGQLIVFHDNHLLRMTGLDRILSECDYEDLKDLKLLTSEETIPTFEAVLSCVNGQVPLMIEFKNDTSHCELERKSYDLLKDYKGAYVIQSFNPLSVLWFKKHAKEVVRGQLSCRHEKSKINLINRFIIRNVMTNVITRPDFVIYDIKALDAFIIKWLKFRKKPLYGYTAKSPDTYQQAIAEEVKPVFEGFDPESL